MESLERHAADIRVLDALADHFRAVPAGPSGHADAWKALSESLIRLGVGARERNGWISWAHARSRPDTFYSIRLLHPMEKALVDSQAESFLLDAVRTRLVTPDQLEQVLETCATLPHLPAGGVQVRSIVSKLLSREMEQEGFLNVQ